MQFIDQPDLTKISARVTVQDVVYTQLRHALMWGKFEPGQVITIASLSAEFGTSHMPVREALRRLAAENGLEVGRNGSAFVPEMSQKRLDDIFCARLALETEAARLAAQRISPVQLEELAAIAAEHEHFSRTNQFYDMLKQNYGFHFAIYRASDSEILPQLIETLWLRLGPYMRLLSDYISRNGSILQNSSYSSCHPDIIAALRARDGDQAARFIGKDIETTQLLLQKLCSNEN